MPEHAHPQPPETAINAAAPDQPPAFDRSLLIPLVKAVVADAPDGHTIDLQPDDMPISRPFVADLIIMYALDHPDNFEFIAPRHLRENGLSLEQLHALALDNLPARTPQIELHGDAPRHMVTAGGNLEATLLLHAPLWEQLAEHLPGEPLAVVPARDLLFVSGTGWDGALEFLTSVANTELEDARHALSQCVLVRRDGLWQVHTTA